MHQSAFFSDIGGVGFRRQCGQGGGVVSRVLSLGILQILIPYAYWRGSTAKSLVFYLGLIPLEEMESILFTAVLFCIFLCFSYTSLKT